MTLKFELGLDFFTMQLPTKFHHPMSNHSELDMPTNTSTNRFCWKHPLCSAMHISGEQEIYWLVGLLKFNGAFKII